MPLRPQIGHRLRPLAVAAGLAASLCALAGPVDTGKPEATAWHLADAWSDEFDGESLDAGKWVLGNPYWPGIPPGRYMDGNVVVADGKLQLWAKADNPPPPPERFNYRQESYHTYSVASASLSQKIQYGYFEVRAKPMPARINCAFWLYEYVAAGQPGEGTYEIDVFEIGATSPGRERTVHTNYHVFLGDPAMETAAGRISESQKWEAPGPLADGFSIYALLWNEQELAFFVDGQKIRSMPNLHFHRPMTVKFTAETHPNWFGVDPAELPAAFEIDYIRTWREVPLAALLVVGAAPGGTTVPPAGGRLVSHGAPMPLRAVPAPGHVFRGWQLEAGLGVIAEPNRPETTIAISGGTVFLRPTFAPEDKPPKP